MKFEDQVWLLASLTLAQRELFKRLTPEKQELLFLVCDRPGLMAREYGPLLETATGDHFYYGDMAQKLKDLADRCLIDRAPIAGSRHGKVWRYYPIGKIPTEIPPWTREVDEREDLVLQAIREIDEHPVDINAINKSLIDNFSVSDLSGHHLAKILGNLRREGKVEWREVTGPGGYKVYWTKSDGLPRVKRVSPFVLALDAVDIAEAESKKIAMVFRELPGGKFDVVGEYEMPKDMRKEDADGVAKCERCRGISIDSLSGCVCGSVFLKALEEIP